MSILLHENPALILIDIQKGFEDIQYWGGQRNNPEAEENASKLLELWRNHSLQIPTLGSWRASRGMILKRWFYPRKGSRLLKKM